MGDIFDILILLVWGALISFNVEHHHWSWLALDVVLMLLSASRIYRNLGN